jgi:3-keto-L-gulonate-6-phosphate decarboxylase
MTLPLLQLALDYQILGSALEKASLLAPEVDILEAGTLLVCSEGMAAVRALRAVHPEHVVVSDIKGADAGALLAEMCFSAGADWMTIICCAPIATVESALKTGARFGPRKDVQIELFGEWTWAQAEVWRGLGIRQVIYHRGRDAQAAGQSWGDDDLLKIARLAEMGFGVSVTGGITAADLVLFRDIPVKVFIAGRALSDAPDPVAAARAFKVKIAELWG